VLCAPPDMVLFPRLRVVRSKVMSTLPGLGTSTVTRTCVSLDVVASGSPQPVPARYCRGMRGGMLMSCTTISPKCAANRVQA